MTIDDVIRNTDELTKTGHFEQKLKERNIGWYEVSKAIEEGSVEDATGENNIRFRLNFPGPDLLVVIDTEKMNLVTAFWEGEPHGRL